MKQSYDDVRIFGTMKKCPVCGKEFLVPDVAVWAYKLHETNSAGTVLLKYFCTWGCLRKWEAENKPKRMRSYDTKELEVYAI